MFLGAPLLSLLTNTTLVSYLSTILPVEKYPDGIFDKSFKDYYDYIVVGAGSAGAIVATRLSEDPAVSVLLLEAGGSDLQGDSTRRPWGWGGLTSTLDWGFETVPQNFSSLGYKSQVWRQRRGKVLGGTGSANGMNYAKGNRMDYDRWEKEGCTGWGYKDVLPYFKKMESVNIPEYQNSSVRGHDGPLVISSLTDSALDYLHMQAATDNGIPIVDCNGDEQIGYCRSQTNIKNGERCSSSSCYLRHVLSRSNLQVNTHSHVTKILIRDSSAHGVNIVRNGINYAVYARKEVILSAGVFGSPHILLLSGIGPKEHLKSFKIPLKADLPVGKMLQEHLQYHLYYSINTSLNIDSDDKKDPGEILNYILQKKGLYARTSKAGNLFYRFDDSDDTAYPDFMIGFSVTISGSTKCSHKRLIDKLINDKKHRSVKKGFSLLLTLLHPKSRGNVQLQSKDPIDPLLIDPKYLSYSEDADMLLKLIRFAQRFSDNRAWHSIGAVFIKEACKEECSMLTFDTDDYWKCMIYNFATAGNHQIGTCRMGSIDDSTSVVDPQLRVKGIHNLRVVDSSVMRHVTSCNINAPTMMIAEKAADIIRGRDINTNTGPILTVDMYIIVTIIALQCMIILS